jgi:HSP20 family protein
VAKEDVELAIDGRRVSVQARARSTNEKKDGDRLIYSERVASNYSRSFLLPAEVIAADADARLDNGVLTLTLAKRGANGGARITVR